MCSSLNVNLDFRKKITLTKFNRKNNICICLTRSVLSPEILHSSISPKLPSKDGDAVYLSKAEHKKILKGAWEMAQQLRVLTTLARDLSSAPSTHTVVHNYV